MNIGSVLSSNYYKNSSLTGQKKEPIGPAGNETSAEDFISKMEALRADREPSAEKKEKDWRDMTDEEWEKMLENVDDSIEEVKEEIEEMQEKQQEAAKKASAEAPAEAKTMAATSAALRAFTDDYYGYNVLK